MSSVITKVTPVSVPSRRDAHLARAITRTASKQTYYTILLLADHNRVADAFRAYAYFRWVDDRVDDPAAPPGERAAFLRRQQALLDAGYHDRMPTGLCDHERLLAQLIAADQPTASKSTSGLRAYLNDMMAVMTFDMERRGRLISATELDAYSDLLAAAVSEALLHFIGHGQHIPSGTARHAGVRGAHIIHMLRDAAEDMVAGYYNVPAEYLAAHGLAAGDLRDDLFDKPGFRDWVAARVRLARDHFAAGRAFLAGLESRRCRLAGHAYIARFEYLAGLIERDAYRLRPAYPERQSLAAAVWMGARVMAGAHDLQVQS